MENRIKVKHPASGVKSVGKCWLHQLCCRNPEALLFHLRNGDRGGSTWEASSEDAAHTNRHKMTPFSLSPGQGALPHPTASLSCIDTVTFTKTPGGLGSTWLCLYLNSERRTLSWRRSGTTVYTISVRPRIKVPESGLGLNPHWAPCLLAVWPHASYLASLSFSFLFYKWG